MYSNFRVRDGDPYSFMYSNFRVRILAKITKKFKMSKKIKSLIFFYKTVVGQFAMSHDLNVGSEILILGRDIRSRSCLNIGDSYGATLFT